MASDLSSGCTEVIEILDEKEEGEISLEDVSSSEEGQLNERSNSRRKAVGQCSSCLSTKHCTSWCTTLSRPILSAKSAMKKDTVQEKENYHHTKESGYSGSKHPTSTLQENNSDLIPISSDSDMEIVGLADNVKQVQVVPQPKTVKNRKRKKKKRSQNNLSIVENTAAIPPLNSMAPASCTVQKRDSQVLKDNHLPKAYHRESNSSHKHSGSPISRSRIVKSPLRRHRSPTGRAKSPLPKSRTPPGRPRSPVLRKSPVHRPRSPVRQSLTHSSSKSPSKRPPRTSVSPANTYIDMYGNVTKLLKKVRHLKSVGSQSANRKAGKHKGHGSSLKDKLNNMMKGESGSNELSKSDNKKKSTEEIDDEEDLALLRKLALETKSKRSKEDEENKESKKVTHFENDTTCEEDVEDLELRMIALRSAMLKKHQNRQQRGMIAGKTKKSQVSSRTNTESPFSQSFLDSIPIPNNENKEHFKTPPCTPMRVPNENTNPEDMELDSEVELEKEREAEPYSPTDKISRKIIVDTELLGIQPSDVSFVTPSSQNTVSSNTSSFNHFQSNKIEVIQTGASYLPVNQIFADNFLPPDIAHYSRTNVLPCLQSPTSSVISIVNPIEALEPSRHTNSEDNLPAAPYSPSQPIETPDIYFPSQDDPYLNSDFSQIPETPYSPTDTPMHDLELNNTPSLFDTPSFQTSNVISKPADTLSIENLNNKRSKSQLKSSLIKINLIPKLLEDINKVTGSNIPGNTETTTCSFYPDCRTDLEKDNASETSSMKADVGSAFDSSANSPDSTMIVVDQLPETDLDGSPLVPVLRELRDVEMHIPTSISQEIIKIAQEPSYLQGVPDVTKDVNKIPTLVNRSLVPASILKSNKNLQQRLPPKKIEQHLEPTFKSADMQPVQISTEISKGNRNFKPIKLVTAIKKPPLRMVSPAAFNCSSNDNSFVEQEKPGNGKSAYGTCPDDIRNLTQDLQNEHQNQAFGKSWEKTDTLLQSGNSLPVSQSTKTLPASSTPEQRPIILEGQKKYMADILRDKKKRSSKRNKLARKRWKRMKKAAKDKKCIETKDKMDVAAKVIVDKTAVDQMLSHRHTQSSNKTDQNQIFEDINLKTRNSQQNCKKPVIEKGTKDRDKHAKNQSVLESDNQSKSGHKHDVKLLNNNKSTNENIEEEGRVEIQKQSRKTMEIQEHNDHSIWSTSTSAESRDNSKSQGHCIDVEKTSHNNTTKQLEAASNTNKKKPSTGEKLDNNATKDLGETKSSDSNGTNGNISNSSAACNTETKSVGDSATVSEDRTQDSEDSMSENRVCKKVSANKRRRSSLEEDEEALRAILLASLAKRCKPSESFSTTTKTNPLANLSHSSVNTSTESVKDLPSTPGTKVSFNSIYNSSSDNTPPSFGENNSKPSNSFDKNSPLESSPQVNTTNTTPVDNTSSENASQAQTMLPTAPTRKRSISTNAKPPLKKIAKKVPISASTRVVNNAKKYQNTLVQKKLNLQRTTTISNAQKMLNHTNLQANKLIDGSRAKSLITQPLSDTQRFVINLASDSESDCETESPHVNVNESTNNGGSEQKQSLTIPMSDFEKSVDLFLKDVRKKQETAAAVKSGSTKIIAKQKPASPKASVPGKSDTLSTTPLAVRHLPVPLQEEYRRLKQQILEREKLKLHKALINNNSPLSPSSKSSGTPPGPLSPASLTLSPTTSKQNQNIPSNSQSQITTASRTSITRSISIQSTVKTTVSSTTTKVNPVSDASGAPAPVANLSIQIPNELTKVDSTSRNSNNSHIPITTSQTRVVAAVKIPEETVNAKDLRESAVMAKDQFDLKTVQVQLQQGEIGRTVSLGETVNLGRKEVLSEHQAVAEVEDRESAASTAAVKNPLKVNTTDRIDKNLPPQQGKLDRTVSSGETVNLGRQEVLSKNQEVAEVEDRESAASAAAVESPPKANSTDPIDKNPPPQQAKIGRAVSLGEIVNVGRKEVLPEDQEVAELQDRECAACATAFESLLKVNATDRIDKNPPLQQGKLDRTVSLGETVYLCRQEVLPENREVAEVENRESVASAAAVESLPRVNSTDRIDKNPPTDLASGSRLASYKETVDASSIHENDDNSVDSAASTLIISRKEVQTENSCVADSLASTVIISRNEDDESSRLGSVNSENNETCSFIVKPSISKRQKLKSNKESFEKIKDDVAKELFAISALPLSEQKTYLTTVEQNLVKKRYIILDDLSEISINLRQFEMEREVQANMASEVRKLQEQLKLAEERLQAQRSRVSKMTPNITAAYEKFNHRRKECVNMTKVCLGLGCLIIGDNYTIPAAGVQLLNKWMKQVAECTRELSKKKTPQTDSENKFAESSEDPGQTHGSESFASCSNASQAESMPSTILGNTTNEGDRCVINNLVTASEDRENTETETTDRLEMKKIDTAEEETLTLEDSKTMAKPFAERVLAVQPQLTSTPNSSKESSSVSELQEDPQVVNATFILNNPKAGLPGRNNSLEEHRLFQPYTSVLTHLNVPREILSDSFYSINIQDD